MRKRFVPVCAFVVLLLSALVSAQNIGGVTPVKVSGNLTTQDGGTCSYTTSGCVVLQLTGYTSVAVQLTGSWSGTVSFETTLDDPATASSTWVAVSMTPSNSTTTATSATGNGSWSGSVVGSNFRARFSTASSGTVSVALRATIGLGAVGSSGGGGGGAAPTITSGGCTNPAVNWSNGASAFKITIGTSCGGVSTVVLGLSAAPHGWGCFANNFTGGGGYVMVEIATTTTSATISNIDPTTGSPQAFADGTVIVGGCAAG